MLPRAAIEAEAFGSSFRTLDAKASSLLTLIGASRKIAFD